MLPKGFKHSEESKQKIRIAKTGIHPSPETIENIRLSNKGQKRSQETREKISQAQRGRHLTVEWRNNIGLKLRGRKQSKEVIERRLNLHYHCSEETKRKIGLANSGENCGSWKGDNIKYQSLHQWLNKRLPKPLVCEICRQKEPYDLANITGVYNREFKNWKYLCRSCHKKLDLGKIKLLDTVN